MQIRIHTIGSYGDIRPYLALALALEARGHDARILGPDHYSRFVEPAGVRFEPLGPHYDDAETKRALAALAAEPDEKRHPALLLSITRESTLALAERAVELTRDADLVVAHNLSVLGLVAAEAHRKPFVTGHLFPSLIPSSQTWLTGRNFGRYLNPVLWSIAGRKLARSTDPIYAEIMGRFGLRPRENVMLKAGHSPYCNLVALSPSILPRDPIWPLHYETTGYWVLREPDFEPDDDLRAFVEGGEPPVVVTFGSMFGVDATALTRLLLDALAQTGRRAVVQAGWAGLGGVDLPEHVRLIDFVPHEWLFARAGCIVHHGGAGTTAAAIRAGKPQVITYHLGDQQFWCRHLQRLGLLGGGIAHRKLDARWLTQAIRTALDDRALAGRTAAVGRKVAAEDGVGNAIRAIERVVERRAAA